MAISYESSSFDKSDANYTPGDLVTLTVTYTSTDTQANPGAGTHTYEVVPTATDSSNAVVQLGPLEEVFQGSGYVQVTGSLPFNVVQPATEPEAVTVAASDGTHTWVVASNTLQSYDSASGTATWTVVLTTQIPLSFG